MRNQLFILAMLLCIAGACGKEKYITIDHPVSAEFPGDVDASSIKVCNIDLCGTTMSEDEVRTMLENCGADLIVLRSDNLLYGKSVSEWLASNRSLWGHCRSYAITEGPVTYAGTCRNADASFEPYKMYTGYGLRARWNGVCLLSGTPSVNDLSSLAEDCQRGVDAPSPWVLMLRMNGPSDVLERNSFTDCIRMQYGTAISGLQDFIYTNAGTASLVNNIMLEPYQSFTIQIEGE